MVPKVPKVKYFCYSAKCRSFYSEYHKSFHFFPEISRVENAKKTLMNVLWAKVEDCKWLFMKQFVSLSPFNT